MFSHFSSIFRAVLLTFFVTSLVACGGGSGSSTPLPPAKDTIPPFVVVTKPSSEQIGINVISFIEVTFNETIANVDTNQVSIYTVDANNTISTSRIPLKAEPFSYDDITKTLTIRPGTDLLPATRYRVILNGIKDSIGNVMIGSCEWDFGTVGLADFGVGKTGKCTTLPVLGKPGEPQSVTAVSGNNKVTINWLTPLVGGDPTYYKLEKSLVDPQNFISLNEQLPPTTLFYNDPDVLNGTSYIYRVSAGNDVDISNPVKSNAVTPGPVQGIPGTPQSVSSVENLNSINSSIRISWFEPTTGGTVTYYIVDKTVDDGKTFTTVDSNVPAPSVPASSLTIIDSDIQSGIAYKYRVIAGNNEGRGEPMLSQFTIPGVVTIEPVITLALNTSDIISNPHSSKIVFSPDGTTLAIGDTRVDTSGVIQAGIVHLFIKSGTNWTRGPIVTALTPSTFIEFGSSVAFSPDSLTLLVSSQFNSMRLFTRNGTSWINQPTGGDLLNAGSNSADLGRGTIGEFTSDGNTLAIANWISESVQIYTKSGSTWTSLELLSSQAPAPANFFGKSLSFSSDNSILAIGEIRGSPSTAKNTGTVQLFTKSGINWVFSSVLFSDVPVVDKYFGHSVRFSPSGNTLGVLERDARKLYLYSRTGINFNPSGIIYGAYGPTVSFSLDGNKLLVGNQLFSKIGTTWKLTNLLSINSYRTSAFSQDGTSVAVYLGSTVEIYNSSQFQ